ncbi:hypothetical protein OEZ86_010411 [Tetradesmus obliquus]|nr:hypothetical protein OEZ86_010411 [Tetradesmus obliquus]
MQRVNNLAVVLWCLAATASFAVATKPTGAGARALLGQADVVGEVIAAIREAGARKPSTQLLSWTVNIGVQGGFGPSKQPTGTIEYAERPGPDGTKLSSLFVGMAGDYLNDKNETVGNWNCERGYFETPQTLAAMVSATYSGAKLDTVTIRKQMQVNYIQDDCTGYKDPSATVADCAVTLKMHGKAKCANNKAVSTEMNAEATTTNRGGTCEADAAGSSAMVVVDCGPKRRWEVMPSQMRWKTIYHRP